jgi:hypothetical protein
VLSIVVCTRSTWFCALIRPTYFCLPSTVNDTSEPPPFGSEVALLAAAAFRNPCGVDQISIVRSATASTCGCGAGVASGAAPGGGARFQAWVPLTICTGRCCTGAGRARPGSTTCMRVICTRAAGVS